MGVLQRCHSHLTDLGEPGSWASAVRYRSRVSGWRPCRLCLPDPTAIHRAPKERHEDGQCCASFHVPPRLGAEPADGSWGAGVPAVRVAPTWPSPARTRATPPVNTIPAARHAVAPGRDAPAELARSAPQCRGRTPESRGTFPAGRYQPCSLCGLVPQPEFPLSGVRPSSSMRPIVNSSASAVAMPRSGIAHQARPRISVK